MIDKSKEISNILYELGIYPNLLGYKYIFDAIQMVTSNEKITSLHVQVYPEICDRYDTIPSRVDRAIRHAITSAWASKKMQYHDIFSKYSHRPKNKELIYTIADMLRFNKCRA